MLKTHRHRVKRTHDALVSIKGGTKALMHYIKDFYTKPDFTEYVSSLNNFLYLTSDYALIVYRTAQKINMLAEKYSKDHTILKRNLRDVKEVKRKEKKQHDKSIEESEQRLKKIQDTIQKYKDLADMFRLESKYLARETPSQMVLKEISLRSSAGILWRMKRAMIALDKLYKEEDIEKEYNYITTLGSCIVVMFHRFKDKYKPVIFQKYQHKHPNLDLTRYKAEAAKKEHDIANHLVSIGVRLSLDIKKIHKDTIKTTGKALK